MKELFQKIIEEFSTILNQNHFEKGTVLHQENKVCNTLFLVKSGVLRAYYFVDGKDVTAHFALEYNAITAPDSFIGRKRSRYTIEVLEDAEVFVVNHANLEVYLEDNPHLERLARKFTEAIYIELLERLEAMVFLSASEKYAKLIKNKPSIIQRVSLGHIASYLGITQETLSRVRRQMD